MTFLDLTKPPPGGVWLLVHTDLAWGNKHYCVKADHYFIYTNCGKPLWHAGDLVLTARFSPGGAFVKGVNSRTICWFEGKYCSVIRQEDAAFLEAIATSHERENSPRHVPQGFWERNPPLFRKKGVNNTIL